MKSRSTASTCVRKQMRTIVLQRYVSPVDHEPNARSQPKPHWQCGQDFVNYALFALAGFLVLAGTLPLMIATMSLVDLPQARALVLAGLVAVGALLAVVAAFLQARNVGGERSRSERTEGRQDRRVRRLEGEVDELQHEIDKLYSELRALRQQQRVPPAQAINVEQQAGDA
jgi:hypothetical protein